MSGYSALIMALNMRINTMKKTTKKTLTIVTAAKWNHSAFTGFIGRAKRVFTDFDHAIEYVLFHAQAHNNTSTLNTLLRLPTLRTAEVLAYKADPKNKDKQVIDYARTTGGNLTEFGRMLKDHIESLAAPFIEWNKEAKRFQFVATEASFDIQAACAAKLFSTAAEAAEAAKIAKKAKQAVEKKAAEAAKIAATAKREKLILAEAAEAMAIKAAADLAEAASKAPEAEAKRAQAEAVKAEAVAAKLADEKRKAAEVVAALDLAAVQTEKEQALAKGAVNAATLLNLLKQASYAGIKADKDQLVQLASLLHTASLIVTDNKLTFDSSGSVNVDLARIEQLQAVPPSSKAKAAGTTGKPRKTA